MPTPFTPDLSQTLRERQARKLLQELECVSMDDMARHVSVNGLDLLEKMEERNCENITPAQLEFLQQIRDRLVEKGAL